MAANKITVNKEILTTIPKCKSTNTVATKKIKLDKIRPLKTPTAPSRNNLGSILPRSLSPLAKDCTTMAEDCTPTLPHMAVINGIKKAIAGIAVILDSKLEMTFAPIVPPNMAMMSQGKREKLTIQIAASESTLSEIPVAI